MLEALQAISVPGPNGRKAIHTPVKGPAVKDTVTDTPVGSVAEENEKKSSSGSEDGRAETTDDEMDEDAVLLKRPTED
jgi:hypothetical protein